MPTQAFDDSHADITTLQLLARLHALPHLVTHDPQPFDGALNSRSLLNLGATFTFTGDITINPSSGTPLTVQRGGTTIFVVNGTTAPTLQGYGPTAGGLVDLTLDTGTFTAVLTGCTSSLICTATWSRVGKLVTLNIPAVTGTSNTTSLTLTGLPAVIQPATIATQWMSAGVCENDSANTSAATIAVNAGSGTMTLALSRVSAGWTNGGTKGVAALSCSYLLN